MTALLSVLAFAALFALAGLLRSKRACASNCGACSGGCHRLESNHDDA